MNTETRLFSSIVGAYDPEISHYDSKVKQKSIRYWKLHSKRVPLTTLMACAIEHTNRSLSDKYCKKYNRTLAIAS